MVDFSKGRHRLQVAIVNRANRKLVQIKVTNAIAAMDFMQRSQAISLTGISKGDNAIIETTGFMASKDGKSVAIIPDMPADVKLISKTIM